MGNRMNKYIQLGDYSYSGVKPLYEHEDGLWGYETEVIGANVLAARAATNGYQGGDAGHGGHSYIELEDMGGTAMEVSVNDEKIEEIFATGETLNPKVRIDVFGDTELMTLINALRFMADALEEAAEYAESVSKV